MEKTNGWVVGGIIIILFIAYLVEVTRKIVLSEDGLSFERAFHKTKRFALDQIDGLYIYSLNKKFLNKNTFTTKLVVVNGSEKFRFTLSGIDTRAVLNMMKENFGINENKMYIAQKTK